VDLVGVQTGKEETWIEWTPEKGRRRHVKSAWEIKMILLA
jgi:hypothetical protein